MLQQVGKDEAEAVRRAADAEHRAITVADPKLNAEHRMAQSWRFLARSYEFQHALGRFVSFLKTRQMIRRTADFRSFPSIRQVERQRRKRDTDFLDRILRHSIARDPQRADKIIGRFRTVQNANHLLTATTARPITLRDLLSIEFASYGENRLVAHGPDIEVTPEAVRHLSLILHELTANSARYGALTSPDERVFIDWKWNGGRRIALSWTDSGEPGACPLRTGFDSQVFASCVEALDGSFDVRLDRGRCSFRITARIR